MSADSHNPDSPAPSPGSGNPGSVVDHDRAMAAVRRLADKVSHDLNNHLMVIIGNCDLASGRLKSDPERAQRMLGEIEKASRRAELYLQRLQTLARVSRRRATPIDPGSLLLELESKLSETVGAAVELQLDAPTGLGSIEAASEGLEATLLALAASAGKSMGGQGILAIRVGEADGHVQFVVTDSSGHGAPGVDPHACLRVLEPFLAARPKSDPDAELSLIQGFIKDHGGTIQAIYEGGVGTRVTVSFPVAGSSRMLLRADDPAAAIGDAGDRGTGTILVVDDQPPVRDVVKDALEDAGFRVLTAEGGAEALDMATTYPGPIDLLLTDIVMPKMDGTELAVAFNKRFPETPILLMSAYSRVALPGTHGGTSFAFLAKPFTPQQLATKVEAVLRGAA